MKIQVKKIIETTEEVEVGLPAYFKGKYYFSMITETGIVSINRGIISLRKNDSVFYGPDMRTIIEKDEPCTCEEFEEAHKKFLESFYEIKNGVPEMETA